MIISIASGKGGTGKTTIATSLALALAGLESLTFLDCDVEEPNARFFLKPKIDTREPVHIPIPFVLQDHCTGCGECAKICAFNALAVIPGEVLVFEELCHGCGGCQLLCPVQAIKEKMVRIGTLNRGSAGAITFIEGCLDVGRALSPPLIRAVKKSVKNDNLVLIDAPPGTSCPVVETIRHSDFTLLVTEPTPFGLNDLKLAVETLRIMKIPCAVIMNRSGRGEEDMRDYCSSENIPILLSIPLDRDIAVAYSRGKPLVEAKPEYLPLFRNLYRDILLYLGKVHSPADDNGVRQ